MHRLAGLVLPILAAFLCWYLVATPWHCPSLACCLAPKRHCSRVVARGSWDHRYHPVVDLLEESMTLGWDVGASVYVQVDGKPVVDIVGGYTDPKRQIPLHRDHVNLIMSNGKILENIGVAILVDRGLVDLQTPIAHYWSEFAQQGKQDITLQDVLSHRSGSAGVFPRQPSLETFQSTDLLDHFLASTAMVYPRGTVRYRSWTSSLYTDAVCRRVDPKGRTLHQLVKEEVFDPLNESLVCPPLTQDDHALVTPVHGAFLPAVLFGILPQVVFPGWAQWANLNARMTLGPEDLRLFRGVLFGTEPDHPTTKPTIPRPPIVPANFNDRDRFLSYPLLSANCMSNARGGARALQHSFGEDGTLLSEQTRRAFLEPLDPAFDRLLMRTFHHTASGLGRNMLLQEPHTNCVGWFGIGGSTTQHCTVCNTTTHTNRTFTYSFIPNTFSPIPYMDRTLLKAIVDILLTHGDGGEWN